MTTRLGLDIGTNSIGWCLYENDSIRDIGVRIFADGRDPKSGTSLAVDRRNARAMRRRRDRYLRRRSALLEALAESGLMPANSTEAKMLAGTDPYILRAEALNRALTPYELGRVLFHLNQRRGFKSNRKAERKAGDDADKGKITNGAKALDAAMLEVGAKTYGAFLSGRATKRVRMPLEGDGYDFYPERRHLEEEFDKLWAEQVKYHQGLLTDVVRERIHRIIFFQRPLKEAKVGCCTFFNYEPRLPKRHPLFQELRLYQEINHLEITHAGACSRKLTLAERDKLVLKLKSVKTASFSALGKLLKLADGENFNKASENRKDLRGDEIFAAFSDKKCFGTRWAHFDVATRWTIIEQVADEEDPFRLYAWLMKTHGVTREQAEAIGRVHLPEGYGRLGEKASRLILDELKKDVITFDKAVEIALGRSHSDFQMGEICQQLPYYGEILTREIPPGTFSETDDPETRWGRITNPTVHIGLNQLRKLVNAIIQIHGRPDEIVVELARELKLNEKEKTKYNQEIGENTRKAKARSEKLQEAGYPDSGANRMLLRLWEELNPANPLDRRCPFCGGQIGQKLLFSGDAEIEHIIPYSRSFDDSAANKVIAHRHCNREKGNKTPWEQWGGTDKWPIIADQVSRLHKSKQWRFAPDAMERIERDRDFIDRQLTDTQYLSRMAHVYLSSLYPKSKRSVYVIPGRMTAMLRRLWGLNDLLPDHNLVENPHSNAPKNRLDHRHHAIDAAVVGATTRGMLNKIAQAAGRAEEQHLDKMFDGLPMPWSRFRDDLAKKLQRMTISHKPDHGRAGLPAKGKDVTSARLHNDTAYGLTPKVSKGGVPIVVHRIPLLSLKPADLADEERIPDETLRRALMRVTNELTGKAFEQALVRFSKEDDVFRGIRHIRVYEPLSVIPIRDKAGHIYKGYKGDSNARFEVWQMPDGKWQSITISTFDAHQKNPPETRPHPAAKKILNLRQNDLIAIEREVGTREIMVVKQISAKQIQLVPHQEAGNLRERDKSPEDPFKFFAPTAGGLKKIKARQIRVDELGRVLDPGPY